jgi:hypothetical protein
MKKVTISSKNINAKQWSNLILELNLMKKTMEAFCRVRD